MFHANAANVTLTQRGDMATGWSLAWKINFWARLEDGNHAYKLIQMLLTPDRTDPNLFDEHPPFQIDGNFGAVSGINEMLLQSQNNEINFLPALPDRWATGSFRGLRARGGFVIDSIIWDNKTMSKAVISSHAGSNCNVRHKTTTNSFSTETGMTYELDGSLNVIKKYRSGDSTSVKKPFSPSADKKSSLQASQISIDITNRSGKLFVKSKGNVSDLSVRVFNLSGRLVYELNKNENIGTGILVPHINKGIYIVHVKNNKLGKIQKVIIN